MPVGVYLARSRSNAAPLQGPLRHATSALSAGTDASGGTSGVGSRAGGHRSSAQGSGSLLSGGVASDVLRGPVSPAAAASPTATASTFAIPGTEDGPGASPGKLGAQVGSDRMTR